MYQEQILKSILLNRDAGAVSKIAGKHKDIFPDKQYLSLYNIIRTLTTKQTEVPDIQFFKEYFKLEKTSKDRELFNTIISSDEATTKNTLSLIELQLQYIVRKKSIDTLKEYQATFKISSGSELEELQDQLFDELNSIRKIASLNTDTEVFMYHNSDDETNEIKAKLLAEYDERKKGTRGYYKFDTGIQQIDDTIGGVHNTDFIGILGFVKNGKSFLARQISYNVLCQGKNVLFVTLEMSAESIQHSFLSLHANNVLYWGYDSVKIKTADIRSGTLSDKAEEFYRNKVIDDFTTNPDMGSLYIIQPTKDYSPSDLFTDVRTVMNTTMDVDLLVIDYPGLMLPSTGYRDRDSYNQLFRELRGFGLNMHLPTLIPLQANRHGFDSACKDKNNLYSPDAISDYSSIERECTNIFSIITTPEMKEAGQSQVQHLLARESALSPVIRLNSDFETGTLTSLQTMSKEDSEQMINEIDID